MANSYGFLVHPYLTLNRISQDHSQIAIFTSLWLGAWMGILIILGILLVVIPWFFPQLGQWAKWGVGISGVGAIFLLFFTLYLLYWLIVWQRKRR